jgi:hypothetical protein
MRNRFVLAADLAVIALSVLGAFVLRLDWFFGRQPEYTAAFRFFWGRRSSSSRWSSTRSDSTAGTGATPE